MKARNTVTSVLVVIVLAASIGVIIATWQTRKVQAIRNSGDGPSPYGFIELAAGQSARLTIVNPQPPPEPDSPPPDPEAPADHVRLAFDVYVQDEENTGACGGVVPMPPTCLVRYRFLRRESRQVRLMPGQAASLNFTAVDGAKVQAFIQSLGGPDTRGNPHITPEPHLVPSLEVREGTRTLFVVPALAKFFNPQPDPPGQQQ
jgi:hypothetical protein